MKKTGEEDTFTPKTSLLTLLLAWKQWSDTFEHQGIGSLLLLGAKTLDIAVVATFPREQQGCSAEPRSDTSEPLPPPRVFQSRSELLHFFLRKHQEKGEVE